MVSVISAGLPILIGVAGTLIGYSTTNKGMHGGSVAPRATMIQAWHSELASPTFVGAAVALPLFVLLGVLFTYRTKHLQGKRSN